MTSPLHGPRLPTWAEHDSLHPSNPLSSSGNRRYVLDDYDEDHGFCWRCRMRVLRLSTRYRVHVSQAIRRKSCYAEDQTWHPAQACCARKLARVLKSKYEKGASIRQLCKESGRSYGIVHRMLAEAGVQFRPRGVAGKAAEEAAPQFDQRSAPILSRTAL
ncbi:helix-turn-helix domain-containing protein [Saccharopolyspora hattusasensis]|uniref:helix-turn-helix domain-containing protein n=1 Tax=Saccharopolyspora hattusasensis TaxID=1128679 RepID=UPI003D971CF6